MSEGEANLLPAGLRKGWVQALGVTLGLGLFAAAVVFILSAGDELEEAMASLRRPSPLLLSLLGLCVVGNLVLTATLFRLLLSRWGRVRFKEMHAIIAATTLLNYLPMRPGLYGRIAYHKHVHGIPIVRAAQTVIESLVLGAVVAGWFFLAIALDRFAGVSLWVTGTLPVPVLAAGAIKRSWRLWALAGLVRYLDVLLWVGRYALAFALVGKPIPAAVAGVLACVSMLATLVPFLSNGLGVREWAIGFVTPIIDPGQLLGVAVTADLVNRAVEVLVILAAGALGMTYLTGTHVWPLRREAASVAGEASDGGSPGEAGSASTDRPVQPEVEAPPSSMPSSATVKSASKA